MPDHDPVVQAGDTAAGEVDHVQRANDCTAPVLDGSAQGTDLEPRRRGAVDSLVGVGNLAAAGSRRNPAVVGNLHGLAVAGFHRTLVAEDNRCSPEEEDYLQGSKTL